MALDLALNPQLEAVRTVTGAGVNNTDPKNPVISYPSVGDIGAVPTSRTLTINGATFDLTANRTWNVGTVLSVTGDGVNNVDPNNPVISYPTVGDIGAVPTTRTLTINGTGFDLTANRTWSVGTVLSVTGDGVDNIDPDNPVISYPTVADIGAVPTTRTLTINGVEQDLSVDRTFNSYVDYEPSVGDLLFSPVSGKPRKYGFTTARTGNLLIDPAGANEGIMIKVRHNDAAEPSVSVIGGGVTIVKEGGDYLAATDNYIYLICHKNDAGTLSAISYTISTNQL